MRILFVSVVWCVRCVYVLVDVAWCVRWLVVCYVCGVLTSQKAEHLEEVGVHMIVKDFQEFSGRFYSC